MRANRILYISYDGMLEPLGQSQVLAYLEQLASEHRIYLLSFEKAEDWSDEARRAEIEQRIRVAGIRWYARRYHKRPALLAKPYDLLFGLLTTIWAIWRHRVGVVHARSYVPGTMALIARRITGARFLFDMRGFWADERVDGGLWPRNGRLYRMAKWLERQLLLGADHIVSLTNSGVQQIGQFDYMRDRPLPISVIPTCVDLARFRPREAVKSGFVFGYVGSVGTWYAFDTFVACFAQLCLLKPDARLLILNRNEHQHIRAALNRGDVPPERVELRSSSYGEVPELMARMHATAFFIKPMFSKLASAPTKLGEFLGCGIPCLANTGVGDMAEILEGERVGVAIENFQPESLAQGLRKLLALVDEPNIAARCSAAAQRHFSLKDGVSRYDAIYRQLVGAV